MWKLLRIFCMLFAGTEMYYCPLKLLLAGCMYSCPELSCPAKLNAIEPFDWFLADDWI